MDASTLTEGDEGAKTGEKKMLPLEVCESSDVYGRSSEQEQILQAYHDMNKSGDGTGTTRRTSFVLVKGSAGCGKRYLITKTLQPLVEKDAGFFLCYRWDQYMKANLVSIFDESIDDLVEQCIARGEETIAYVNRVVEESTELSKASLTDSLPNLKRILGKDCKTKGWEDQYSSRRGSLVKSFLKALSSEKPIVFLLQDIQWAHPFSLESLSSLIPDLCDSRVLFLATFRDDDVIDTFFFDRDVPKYMENQICTVEELIEQWARDIRVDEIKLHGLDEDAIGLLVSNTLQSSVDSCRIVSEFVFRVSSGNPLFAVELMRSMNQASVLSFDVDRNVWECDEQEVQTTLSCSSILDLLLDRLRCQSTDVQELLKVSACLGFRINESLLAYAFSAPVAQYLRTATDGYFLRHANGRYWFQHVKMQEAAYSLIPQAERRRYHFALGRTLVKNIGSNQVEFQSVVATNFQLQLGASLMNQKEKTRVASLLLTLGRKAAVAASFTAYSFLLERGISLLGEDHWIEEHDLSLALYNTLAEVKYTMGDFDRVGELVGEIFNHAHCLDDKLQAYCTQIYMLIAQDKMNDAINIGLGVLRQLGNELAPNPTRAKVRLSLLKTKFLLRGKTSDQFLRKPLMEDARQIASMQIMNLLFTSALLSRPLLAPIIATRMVQITVQHGLCAISSVAFAAYGMLLCSTQQVKEGYRYGQLALDMLEKFQARQWLPRVYAYVYAWIHNWCQPMDLTLGPIWRAVIIGLETGDIEYAMLNANLYCFTMFALGRPLPVLKQEFSKLAHEMQSLNQAAMLKIHLPFMEMVEIFLDDNEAKECDRGIRERIHFENEVDEANEFAAGWIHFQKSLLAYVFCDYELAVEEGKLIRQLFDLPFQPIDVINARMLYCLSLLALCKTQSPRRQRKVIGIARRHMMFIERAARTASQYCLGKLFLLRAEVAAVTGHKDDALSHFSCAIALSSKARLLLDEAISLERAARYMMHNGEMTASKGYFEEAIGAYTLWGALGKARRLKEEASGIIVS